MCQNKNFNSLKGDIVLDSRNAITFIVDPHGIHTIPAIAKGVTHLSFQGFAVFLMELEVMTEAKTSRCNMEVLQGLHTEFEQMRFCEALTEILEGLGITPQVPEVKALKKNWFEKFFTIKKA